MLALGSGPTERCPQARPRRDTVARDQLKHRLVLAIGAELHDLGLLLLERDVAGGQVVGIPGVHDLLAIVVPAPKPAPDGVPPEPALAATVGQPLEGRR